MLLLLLLSKAKEALKEEREMLKQPLWEHWKSGKFGAWDLILFDQSSFLLASVYFEEGGGLVVRFSLNRDCFNGHIFLLVALRKQENARVSSQSHQP